MEVLDEIKCLTTDPTVTTFYAFTYDNTYDGVCPTYNDIFEAIHVKSNSNPVSATNLTWSVVSRIDSRSLTGTFTSVFDTQDYSCAVNAHGVFTLVGRSKGTVTFNTPTTPLGIRYDPTCTMDSKYNFKGPAMAYVNNNGGSSVLVHAFMDSGFISVNIPTLGEGSKTLTAAAVWFVHKATQL